MKQHIRHSHAALKYAQNAHHESESAMERRMQLALRRQSPAGQQDAVLTKQHQVSVVQPTSAMVAPIRGTRDATQEQHRPRPTFPRHKSHHPRLLPPLVVMTTFKSMPAARQSAVNFRTTPCTSARAGLLTSSLLLVRARSRGCTGPRHRAAPPCSCRSHGRASSCGRRRRVRTAKCPNGNNGKPAENHKPKPAKKRQ